MTWVSVVACAHQAALGRPPTVAPWSEHEGCRAIRHDRWQVGIQAGPADRDRVLGTLLQLLTRGLPASSTLTRLAVRTDLPTCSVLLTDGEQLAALAWGEPLGVVELAPWEYAVTAAAPAGLPWERLAPRSVLDLADCGLTRFPLAAPSSSDPDQEPL